MLGNLQKGAMNHWTRQTTHIHNLEETQVKAKAQMSNASIVQDVPPLCE